MSFRTWSLQRWSQLRSEVGVSLESDRWYLSDSAQVVSEAAAVSLRVSSGKIANVGDEALADDGQKGLSVVRPFAQGQITNVGFGSSILQALVRKSQKRSLLGCHALVSVSQSASPLVLESIERTLAETGCVATEFIPTLLASRLGAHLPDGCTGSVLALHLEVDSYEQGWVSDTFMVDSCSMPLDIGISELIHKHVLHRLQLSLRPDDVLRLMQAHLSHTPATSTAVHTGLETVDIEHETMVEAVEPLLVELVNQVRQLMSEIPVRVFEEVMTGPNLLTGIPLPGLPALMKSELGLDFQQGPSDAPVRGLAGLLRDRKLRQEVACWTARPKSSRPSSPDRSRTAAHFLLALSILLALAYAPSIRAGKETAVDRVLNTLVVPAQSFLSSLRDRTRPDTRIVALDREQKRRVQSLVSENRRLHGLLALREKHYKGLDEGLIFARVLSKGGSGILAHLTIDKGSKDGLAKEMIVSSAEGLVGVLSEVNKLSSRARLFTNSPLTASIEHRDVGGVVVSRSEHDLEMLYLDPNVQVEKGDRVLTNGLDGVYPEGLLVGSVSKVQLADGPYRAVSLQPATQLDGLWEVLVLQKP